MENTDFSNLRQNILKHQWKEANELLSVLFANDIPKSTIFVAEQMLWCHLRFQSRYALLWIADFAQEVTDFIRDENMERKVPDLPEQVDETFADAPYGVPELIGGVVELHKSISTALSVQEQAMHLALAQNRFVVAEISDYWASVYPEEFRLREEFWNAAETRLDGNINLPHDLDKGKLYRGIGFLKQPESLAYRSARLLSVADELEMLLLTDE